MFICPHCKRGNQRSVGRRIDVKLISLGQRANTVVRNSLSLTMLP